MDSRDRPGPDAPEWHEDEQPPPPRDNPVVWVLVVGAILLSVPLTSEWFHSSPRARAQQVAQHVTKERVELSQPPARVASPVEPDAGAPPAREPVPTVKAPVDESARQVVTKCVDGGRTVYTQAAACTRGSMSTVTVEPDRNVVGAGAR